MPELSENDIVVTPSILGGNVGKVVDITEYDGNKYCSVDVGNKQDDNVPCEEVVRVKESTRVKVGAPEEAECVVALAEENGFDLCPKHGVISEAGSICLQHETKQAFVEDDGRITAPHFPQELTFESDYAQIKAWLTYHGESEDGDCDDPKCDDGIIVGGPFQYPCPDCSEDSSEPRPEEIDTDAPTEQRVRDAQDRKCMLGQLDFDGYPEAEDRDSFAYCVTDWLMEALKYINDLECGGGGGTPKGSRTWIPMTSQKKNKRPGKPVSLDPESSDSDSSSEEDGRGCEGVYQGTCPT